MIAQGTDGLSRGSFLEGVVSGSQMLSFIDLALPATILELHPIRLPVGLPVSVSYRPSSVGIFGMVLGLTNAETT